MSDAPDALATLRAAMATLAIARGRYEMALSVFTSARDGLGTAIEAAQEASAAALAAAFEEKV